MLKYILITPARNEERTIENTIKALISQTMKPEKWIIVSDGSTDATDEIVKKYTVANEWITLLRSDDNSKRTFSAKARCFEYAYQSISHMEYDIIGNLDADITVDDEYFEFLLRKFSENSNLGVAGTPFREEGYNSLIDSNEGEFHVAGGCQLFRKECYHDIGGYPKVWTGIDWIAVTTARMKGWETRSFPEKFFFHHRKLGTGGKNIFRAKYEYGCKDYCFGGHPLWQAFRAIYQINKKPYIVGSFLISLGYMVSVFTFRKKLVSKELASFHRKEQMRKLKKIIQTKLSAPK